MYNQLITVTTSNVYRIEDFKPKFELQDVVVTKEVKQEFELISQIIKKYKEFQEAKIPTKRGILLNGIPGTGKTTIVNALIEKTLESGGTVFKLIADSGHNYQQNGNITEYIFFLAKKYTPALIILEDFDLIASNRSSNSIGTINNQLLELLENKNMNTVVVATTNIIENIDEAAIRSGRIDKTYTLDYPDLEMKKKLVEIHKKYYNIEIDVFNILNGFLKSNITGATISSILLTAKQKAKIENRNVSEEDLKWAISGLKVNRQEESIL